MILMLSLYDVLSAFDVLFFFLSPRGTPSVCYLQILFALAISAFEGDLGPGL